MKIFISSIIEKHIHMQINFENFKIFLIITRVKFLLGVEF
jgi:hypothetical protein